MTPTAEQLKSALAKAHGGITYYTYVGFFKWDGTTNIVTEREWLQICQDVEVKLTGAQALKYEKALNEETKCFKHITAIVMIFATYQQRALALLKIGAISLE